MIFLSNTQRTGSLLLQFVKKILMIRANQSELLKDQGEKRISKIKMVGRKIRRRRKKARRKNLFPQTFLFQIWLREETKKRAKMEIGRRVRSEVKRERNTSMIRTKTKIRRTEMEPAATATVP